MRTPIAHALGWPERLISGVPPLDLFAVGRLDFEPPDLGRFPCLGLAIAAAASGGTAPAVLNAANEVAVAAFLGGRIGFMGIADVVEETLAALPVEPVAGRDIAFLLHVDAEARTIAEQAVKRRVT
jgi:1-deoxy-D-xylulose-5-phosphate reductoisomerase